MSAFTLDTSGHVTIDGVRVGWEAATSPSGFYLTPFTQGYVEAAFEDGWDWPSTSVPSPRGFSDLSPATLAAMMGDCEYVVSHELGFDRHVRNIPEEGAALWRKRQGNEPSYGLSPIALYLGEDGLIHHRVAS